MWSKYCTSSPGPCWRFRNFSSQMILTNRSMQNLHGRIHCTVCSEEGRLSACFAIRGSQLVITSVPTVMKRISSISMESWTAFILHGYAGPLAGGGDLAGWLCRAVAWRAHFSLKIQLLAITPTSVMHLPFPKNHVLHLFSVPSIFEIFKFFLTYILHPISPS